MFVSQINHYQAIFMKLYLILLLLCAPLMHAHAVFIIIHGIWPSKSLWHMPGGDFFEEFEKNCVNDHVVSFCWSGKNDHEARVCAAQILTKLIQSYPSETTITIIAHSHGGNVATLASQILAKNINCCHGPPRKYQIAVLYALGTPIHDDYKPDMNVIGHVYNLFSFEDWVQPVLGMFRRQYESHKRIGNMRITIDDKQPDHTNLHNPIVGSWLPQLHTWVVNNNIDLQSPGIIHFSSNKKLRYEIDERRKELIKRDLRMSILILKILCYIFGIPHSNVSKITLKIYNTSWDNKKVNNRIIGDY